MSTSNVYYDYIIVGGGVMGVSCAAALLRRDPGLSVIIFEGQNPQTSSKGISKIIREPYPDKDYAGFAAAAKSAWETKSPYSKFYRRQGWIQEIRGGKYVPYHKEERKIDTREFLDLVKCHSGFVLREESELWLDDDIGIADAALAVEAVAVRAANKGLVRSSADVDCISVQNGVCGGVVVSGVPVVARNTVIAAGAWTPGLLEQSGIRVPKDIFRLSAAGVATMKMCHEEYDRFRQMPILTASEGEILPPDPVQRRLQITSTDFWSIDSPAQLNSCDFSAKVQNNQSLLQRMLPEFKDRAVEFATYA